MIHITWILTLRKQLQSSHALIPSIFPDMHLAYQPIGIAVRLHIDTVYLLVSKLLARGTFLDRRGSQHLSTFHWRQLPLSLDTFTPVYSNAREV